MAQFGLIGHPIAHSQSPALFRAAYPGGAHTYELLPAESVEQAMERFLNGPYTGINVTAPFKDRALEYADAPDRTARLLGSTNLLLKTPQGIRAFNTDYYGVLHTVAPPPGHPVLLPEGLPERVLVIGAGGAGKAAALALRDAGAEVTLANRTPEHAAPFAEAAGIGFLPLERIRQALPRTGMVVYSLAMPVPQLEPADLSGKILFEANYARPSYPGAAPGKGFRYLSGKYWLFNQAVPAFRLFTGEEPNLLQMKKIMGIE